MSTIDETQSGEEPAAGAPEGSQSDPADEVDVDLSDDEGGGAGEPDAPDTIPEGAEYLGSYRSIAAYLQAMLEPEVTPACAWILGHLDYRAVQRRWESDGSRLVLERGEVYRLAAAAPDEAR